MTRQINFILCFIFVLFQLSNKSQAQNMGLWTWMHGQDVYGTAAGGNYGTKGIPSPANIPPGRYQAAYWTDTAGNFWLFGGATGLDTYNDLWKYDIGTNIWTWVSGEQYINNPAGTYGVMGIPSVNNCPSARGYGANCWTDLNNNLWLYGGSGASDDLWKYNIATNEWTWVRGNIPLPGGGLMPVWGVEGVAAPSNTPGSRTEVKSGWVDAQNKLWMYGGIDSAGEFMSDMWMYDMATNMWTCMKGSNSANNAGSYGSLGLESASNIPPSRRSYTKWKGPNNSYYIFGGGREPGESFNDCWRYNSATNLWTWLSGANVMNSPGLYNGYCLSQNDMPKSRIENQTAYNQNCSDVFWTFGGAWKYADTVYNDLWVYNIMKNKWTWVSGSSKFNQIGFYGVKGLPSGANMIPSKMGVAIWLDKKGNVWIFGGITYSANFQGSANTSNDLWRFEPDYKCFGASPNPGGGLGIPGEIVLQNGAAYEVDLPQDIVYSIDPSDGVSFSADGSKLILKPITSTTYTISLKPEISTCSEKEFTIKARVQYDLIIPNVFTPNGDGRNDVIKVYSIEEISVPIFRVYNRYGEQIFETRDISKGWDGHRKEVKCDMGVYFYYLEYTDKNGARQFKKGDFTLIH